jgi:hypothetical protein
VKGEMFFGFVEGGKMRKGRIRAKKSPEDSRGS